MDERGRATRTRWLPSRLSHQTLRTYTDGVWGAERPPSPYALAMLGKAVDPHELDAAVAAALAARTAPGLTVGQRVVL